MASEFSESHIFHEEDAGSQHHSSDAAHIFGPDDVNAALASTAHFASEKTVVSPDKISLAMPDGESSEKQKNESPKNLFMQAYEAVRNTDKVSNIVDNVAIWWKGRHIDAIERDIQRLEGLVGSQNREVIRHEERLQASDEAAAKLAEMKQGLGLRDTAPSSLDHREGEYSAVKGRAEAHRIVGEKIARELMVKRELKEKFEQGREEARSRIAERVQNNIDTNVEAIKNAQNSIDEIQKNLGVAENIVTGLRAKQEQARAVADNPDVLSELKKSAQVIAQELEGRIQDMRSKMQLQSDRVTQYESRKAALETQKVEWEAKIAKKPGPEQASQEQLSDFEKAESFAAETTEQLQEQEDALLGNEAAIPDVAAPALEDRLMQEGSEQKIVEQAEGELATFGEVRRVLQENETMKTIADFLNIPNVRNLDNPDKIREWKDILISDYDKLVHAQGLYKRLYVIGLSENVNEDDVPARLVLDLQTFKNDLERAGYGDIERNKKRGTGTEVPTLLANTYNFLDSFLKNFETVPEQVMQQEDVAAKEQPSLVDEMNTIMNSEFEDPAIDELMNQYSETDFMNTILEQKKSPKDILIVRLLRTIFSMLSIAETTDKANKTKKKNLL